MAPPRIWAWPQQLLCPSMYRTLGTMFCLMCSSNRPSQGNSLARPWRRRGTSTLTDAMTRLDVNFCIRPCRFIRWDRTGENLEVMAPQVSNRPISSFLEDL
jgi:hypothetical protein